jgi:coenzyme F420-reducing hydrogenase alpha subunit
MTRAEIGLSVVGLVSASYNIYLHWRLGGKQQASNSEKDTLTHGADRLIDSSNKLLDKMQQMLEQETERVKVERDHRELCETALKEHQKQLDILKKEVEELKKND